MIFYGISWRIGNAFESVNDVCQHLPASLADNIQRIELVGWHLVNGGVNRKHRQNLLL